ncbi:MAG: hypothetical protein WA939_17265 [Nodosilinea sp.]
MKVTHWLSAALLTWASTMTAALATPEIASGDGIVDANVRTCLSRTDAFVNTLEVNIERGRIDRTGYFGDGSFRILCYPNPYGQADQSLVVIFAAHEDSFDVANSFVQVAVGQIADR